MTHDEQPDISHPPHALPPGSDPPFWHSLFAGCASKKYPPAPASAATPSYNYIIGPLDTVNIIVWRNPDLSTSVQVRPDGKITVPLVEDLPAMGKDSTTLARDIQQAMSKYIRDPIVNVIVTGFVGPYSEQIRVIGEAANPQALPYRQNMTLMDVMIAVGGHNGLRGWQSCQHSPHVRGQQAV